jgi:hypothetical protein
MARQTLKNEQFPSHSFIESEEFHGILVAKQENVGPNNSKLFTIEVSGSKGKKESVWGSAVLDKLFQLTIGTEVWITYLGKKKGKRGTDFKDYKIEFDDSTADIADVAKEMM